MLRARLLMVFAILAVALALPTVVAAQVTGAVREDYFANANTSGAPDATLRIVNTETGPFHTPGVVGTPAGDVCAMIYVFRPDQQLAECCGCRLTPHALLTLSVNNNLTNNPLTSGTLTDGSIVITPSAPNFVPSTLAPGVPGSDPTCNPGRPPLVTPNDLRAWITHIQNASPVASFLTTESDFGGGDFVQYFSPTEVAALAVKCNGITSTTIGPGGSGAGLCNCPGETSAGAPNPDPPPLPLALPTVATPTLSAPAKTIQTSGKPKSSGPASSKPKPQPTKS